MENILVTGVAGFIGSHLCEKLIQAGAKVTCVDNFFTGQRRNLDNISRHPNFQLVEHDIIDPLFIDGPVTQIYNLACPASPVHYQYNPIRTIKANTKGMINVLGLAKAKGARLLQASTSEIYGDPQVHPQTETYYGNVNPIGPRACYDEGKRVAETLCFDYHRAHQLSIRVVRIFNTYGPRLHPQDGRVVSNFIIQALRGQDITIHGDGSQSRSFCYVAELVDGLERMMGQDNATGPINLGNPVEITMQDLAREVIRLTNSSSKLVFEPARPDDPQQRRPDITQARQLLGWQPRTSLEEGLAQTIAYFRNL